MSLVFVVCFQDAEVSSVSSRRQPTDDHSLHRRILWGSSFLFMFYPSINSSNGDVIYFSCTGKSTWALQCTYVHLSCCWFYVVCAFIMFSWVQSCTDRHRLSGACLYAPPTRTNNIQVCCSYLFVINVGVAALQVGALSGGERSSPWVMARNVVIVGWAAPLPWASNIMSSKFCVAMVTCCFISSL